MKLWPNRGAHSVTDTTEILGRSKEENLTRT